MSTQVYLSTSPRKNRAAVGALLADDLGPLDDQLGSLITSAPPSPQVKFFVSWKLSVAQRAEACRAAGRGSVPNRPWALSSTTRARGVARCRRSRPCRSRRRRSAPARSPCVRGVIAASIACLVEVQRVRADVDEDRLAPAQRERVGGRDEGERRARSPRRPADVEQDRGHLQRVRARGREQRTLAPLLHMGASVSEALRVKGPSPEIFPDSSTSLSIAAVAGACVGRLNGMVVTESPRKGRCNRRRTAATSQLLPDECRHATLRLFAEVKEAPAG